MSAKIVSFYNAKGGVGKTTTAVNVSAAWARNGLRVLLVDLDGQASATRAAGVNLPENAVTIYESLTTGVLPSIFSGASGVHLVPSSDFMYSLDRDLSAVPDGGKRLQKLLDYYRTYYDYIVCDCPPAMGIASSSALYASDYIILVCNMSLMTVSTMVDIKKLIEQSFCASGKRKVIGLVWTMNRNTTENRKVKELIEGQYHKLQFESVIRMTTLLSEASGMQQDIFTYCPNCDGARDYWNLAAEITDRIQSLI